MEYNEQADPCGRTAAVARVARSPAPCYVILGKPGVGKTTLARTLALQRNSVHLSVERAVALSLKATANAMAQQDTAAFAADGRSIKGLQDDEGSSDPPEEATVAEDGLIPDEEETPEDTAAVTLDGSESSKDDRDAMFIPSHPSPLALQAAALASAGQPVPDNMGLALLEEIIQQEAVQFHGYVLEGLPCACAPAAEIEGQMARIATWSQPPSVAFLLQASDADIAARWQSALQDPITGIIYLNNELQPSIRTESMPARENEQSDTANDEDDAENGARKEEPAIPLTGAGPPFLSIPAPLSADVVARLVPLPPETQARLLQRLQAYNSAAIEEGYFAMFPPHMRLTLDATLEPYTVANQALEYIHVTALTAAVEPMVLPAPEVNEFVSDASLREAMLRAGLDDDSEPNWITSAFDVYCPVTLVDEGILCKGSADFGVAYLGSFYLCASAATCNHFRQNPDRYLTGSPIVPNRLFVMGHASDEVSEIFSSKTGAMLFKSDRLARSYLVEQQRQQALATAADETENSISFRLGLDSVTEDLLPPIPTEVYLEAIARAVASTGRSDWVLSGFPRNAVEFAQLLDKGVVPGATVFIQHEASLDVELAEVAQSVREKNITAIDVVLPPPEETSDYLCFSIAQGVQKMIEAVQQPLQVLAYESVHEVDEEDADPDPKYGVTRHYCPVALARDGVLRPGNAELAVLHNGLFYRLSTTDNQINFLTTPNRFVTENAPPVLPPLRLILLGPTGAGKLTQARRLARQHGLYCIAFAELLAEKNDAPLSDTAVSSQQALELLRPLWFSEPYRSAGVVLVGFPRDEADAKAMTEVGNLYPDAVVHFEISEMAVQRRRLPRQLEGFMQQRQAVLDAQQYQQEVRQAMTTAHRVAWEQQREQSQRLMAADGQPEQALPEEYVPPDPEVVVEEVEDLEPMEEVRERLLQEIIDTYGQESEQVDALRDLWQDDLQVPVIAVNASLSMGRLASLLDAKLINYTSARASLLCSARVVAPVVARGLLSRGQKLPSVFGRWCPVSLLAGQAIFPVAEPQYSAVHQHHVYYFCSPEHQEQFVRDPCRFLCQPPPPPVVPISVGIVGPPCSGKSTLAQALCRKYGCMHITANSAIEHVLGQKHTALAQQLQRELDQGNPAPPELVVKAVATLLLAPRCQTFGYVLDGFPDVQDHVGPLLLPRKIFELQLPLLSAVLARRGAGQDEAILARLFAASTEALASLRVHYQQAHRNWQTLPAERSKWWLAHAAMTEVEKNVKCVQAYVRGIKAKVPAPVADLPLTPAELTIHLSPWGEYCPVSWVDRQELVRTGLTELQHTVEYRGSYFKLASATEVTVFTQSPERYAAASPPPAFPVAISDHQVKDMFPTSASFQGYCPVTYVEGRETYESLVHGSVQHAVEYGGQIFLLASEGKRACFLRCPKKYCNALLPEKRPPRALPVLTAQLPNLGFMEQMCATLVTKALQSVGLARPKYPYMSSSQSALLYVALYLKAENPKSGRGTRQRYQNQIKQFMHQCQLLKYLARHTTAQHHDARPPGFERELQKFLTLKPTSEIT